MAEEQVKPEAALKPENMDGSGGSADQFLQTDGTNTTWAEVSGGISGETGNERIEYGTANGGSISDGSASISPSFATAFSTIHIVQVTVGDLDTTDPVGAAMLESKSTSSFTANFANINNYDGEFNDNDWMAIGE